MIICTLMLAPVGCNGSAHRQREQVLASITQHYPCAATRFPGVPAQDSLTPAQNCALISAAFRKLAHQPGEGLSPADTAAIDSATFKSFVFSDLNGKPADAYWAVDFVLAGHPYNAFVRIDQRTGTITASRTHKAF